MTSYADRDEIRRTGRFLRRERRNDLAVGSTSFNLGEDGYKIRTFLREGVVQTSSQFSFVEPKKLDFTAGGATVAGEQLIVEYDTQIEDQDIDLAIRHAKEDFRDQLSHIVSEGTLDAWELKTPDQVTEKVMRLAILYVEQMILKANKIYGEERQQNNSDINKALNDFKLYRTGEKKLAGVETDMTSRISIGDGGDLVFVDQPTIDEKLQISRRQDRRELPSF